MNNDTIEHRPPVRILVQVEAQTDVISKGNETNSRASIVDGQVVDGASEELLRLHEVALSDTAGSVEHNDNVLRHSAVIYNDDKLAVDDRWPTIAGLFGRRNKRYASKSVLVLLGQSKLYIDRECEGGDRVVMLTGFLSYGKAPQGCYRSGECWLLGLHNNMLLKII